MGCINSTKKLADIKFDSVRSENVYRVRVIRLLNDTSAIRSGFLELTPKELIFSTQGREPIIWSLQHLRRYGINGDIFSFEAGRRCVTGPGIYVFRCQQAENLYLRFQLHINAVSSSDDHHFSQTQPSHSTNEFGLQHTNNYLEPVPLSAGFRERGAPLTDYHSMSSGEIMNIDSPGSVPSLSFTNEMVHFQGQQPTSLTNTYQNSNLYHEYPMNSNKKSLLKRTSLDVPPDDKAPGYHIRLDVDTNPLHMYENITAATTSNTAIKNGEDEHSERYENFSRIDLPLLQMQPSLKEIHLENNFEGGAMNYIVLDLDNSIKTPTQSPKTISTSDEDATLLSASLGGACEGNDALDGSCTVLTHNINATSSDLYNKALLGSDPTQELQISNPTIDSSLGYSTIDFIKTCALIKSSTYGSEFDQEESRITRHSKCVRKAFSITLSLELPTYLVPNTSSEIQESAVTDLIRRSIGKNSNRFRVEIDDALFFRSFKIIKVDDIIYISGSDGVSIAKGFHYYLKYYLERDVSWTNTQIENFPATLPHVNITISSESFFIYYQNVCTWSYSFAWWQFSIWRKHIDWMAMMGVTLTIAPIQEYIWYDIYKELGLNEKEISEHFAGPAFLSWQRMGNIHGWIGPLSKNYRYLQMLLQQQIIEAQRNLGISVALPAFAGHVPVGLAQRFPAVNFTSTDRWNNFPNKYCCSLFLEPNEELFNEIASKFLKATTKLYGTNHIYFCDPFNEIQPKIAEASYINMTAYNIYNAIKKFDQHGIWLIQGWMFVNKIIFWTEPLIKAFLTAVPIGRMVVLDLQSEQYPQYKRTHSFYGQPFIWCMLHNFGGTLGMHGSVNIINSNIRLARSIENSTMIGVGITPEGIYQNYVMYSLTLERAWMREDFDLINWFSAYSNVRYEVKNDQLKNALLLLKNTVYSYYGLIKMHGKYTITRRPSLNQKPWVWYNTSSLFRSWKYFLSANLSIANGNRANYEHDLVDINRQYLQILADKAYVNLVSAYKERAKERFNYAVYIFREVLNDLERILATNKNFLLGRWIENAKKLASNPLERRLFEMNARNQITSWGPNGQIVDYASKQWSGIVKDYYTPRWELFFNWLNKTFVSNTTFNEKAFEDIVNKDVELPFTVAATDYRIHGNGDTVNVSHNLFNKWNKLIKCNEFITHLRVKVNKLKTKWFNSKS